MIPKLLPLLLLAVCWRVHAADPCAHTSNTIETGECMSKQFAVLDRDLNRAYQELLKRIDAENPKHVDRSTVRRRLLEAQRSWIEFRKQDCEGQYKLFEEGSIRTLRFHSCMIDHTERRISELKNWDRI